MSKLSILAVSLMILCVVTQTARADTVLSLNTGGKRTIRLSRPAARIENQTPELFNLEESGNGRVLTLRALLPGTGRFTVISSAEKGENRREFTVNIERAPGRNPVSRNTDVSQANLRRALPSRVQPLFLAETVILSGNELSLSDIKKIHSLVGRSGYTFVPQYSISSTELHRVIFWLNERLSRTDAEVSHGASGSDLLLTKGTSQLPAGFNAEDLTQILPHLLVVNDDTAGNPIMVNVMFHFVETIESAASSRGIETTGVHSPLHLSLSLSGVESAPLEAYLQYLSQTARTRVVEQPSLLLRSGTRGSLFAGGELALLQRERNRSGVRFHPFGLKANVTPQALRNGEIDVAIDLEFSEPVQAAGESSSSQFSSRKIQTELRLKDGLSKLVARVSSVHESEESGGVPFLSEVPLLKNLFGKETNSGRNRELLLFITGRSSLFQPIGESADLAYPSDGDAR